MALSRENLLRNLPSVDALLKEPQLQQLSAAVPHRIVVEGVRSAVAQARERLLAAGDAAGDPTAVCRMIVDQAARRIRAASGPHYRKVINAAGIILHTALGRAVLPEAALAQIHQQLDGYCLLQADLESGARGQRDGRIEWLLTQLTGAEAATVVNNNAAATLLVLNSVAAGKEVIVSRGQLVEIGGSFRLPEVMAASGATLVEVGTTNKTHLRDYRRAITENTGAILRVHPSNYKITGFTSEVPLEEMVALAHEHRLPLIDDVGAGALIDFSQFGFAYEPTLPDSVRAGADLVTASADKLIGGPQAGLILGKATWIASVRQNPLARAVRVDKLTLAALEATLKLFLDPTAALQHVPTLRMLRRPLSEIAAQAEQMAAAISQQVASAEAVAVEGFSQMGSGSLPTQDLPTRLVAVRPRAFEAGQLAKRLRGYRPPIFTRVQQGQVLIDPRTLLPGEEDVLIKAVVSLLQSED